jgi:hypothetical protein
VPRTSSSQRYGSSTAAAAAAGVEEHGGDIFILFTKGPERDKVAGNLLLGVKACI